MNTKSWNVLREMETETHRLLWYFAYIATYAALLSDFMCCLQHNQEDES
jgi:hypothetical protein